MKKQKMYRVTFSKSVPIDEKLDGKTIYRFREGQQYNITEDMLFKLLEGKSHQGSTLTLSIVTGHGRTNSVSFDLSYVERIEEDTVNIVYSSK